MPDPRITSESVLSTIYSPSHRRRRIWTASTTLATMGIEWYPHRPKANYRRMANVLSRLCDVGQLARRPKLHSHFTLKEVAYERVASAHDDANVVFRGG